MAQQFHSWLYVQQNMTYALKKTWLWEHYSECQRLKPTQMSIMSTMGYKLWLCLHSGKLRSCKNKWSTTVGKNVDELHQHNDEWKKPDRERYKLHDFVDTKDKTSKANLVGKEAGEWSFPRWSGWREHEGFQKMLLAVFLSWMLVTRMCLVCENSLFIPFSVWMLYFISTPPPNIDF